jgi:outer membrane biosynthesis protein TonB
LDRDLRRSAYISAFIHVALIVAAIVVLPLPPLPNSQDMDVDVDLIGPSAPQRSLVKAPGTASAVSTVVHHTEALTENAPKPTPTEAAPPPPPPPPQSKAPPSTTPPKPTAPTSTTPTKEKPTPTKPTSMKSATHQQHTVKAPQPLSQSVLNTLMNLKALDKQKQAPTHVYNPDQNTAPTVGGSPNSTANSGLTGPDRAAIAAHMQPCWNYDGEAENVGSFQVLLQVTTDATGTVREAEVSPQNTGDMSNPLYIAFTQRAVAAVMNYQCANLGPYLPSNLLGQTETFTFLYQPGQ